MKTPLNKQIYAGLMEILKDDELFYRSYSLEYSYLTETGKEALIEYIDYMAPIMIKRYEAELDYRAKQMVFNELKS